VSNLGTPGVWGALGVEISLGDDATILNPGPDQTERVFERVPDEKAGNQTAIAAHSSAGRLPNPWATCISRRALNP
jgi:hypothetical protein